MFPLFEVLRWRAMSSKVDSESYQIPTYVNGIIINMSFSGLLLETGKKELVEEKKKGE